MPESFARGKNATRCQIASSRGDSATAVEYTQSSILTRSDHLEGKCPATSWNKLVTIIHFTQFVNLQFDFCFEPAPSSFGPWRSPPFRPIANAPELLKADQGFGMLNEPFGDACVEVAFSHFVSPLIALHNTILNERIRPCHRIDPRVPKCAEHYLVSDTA